MKFIKFINFIFVYVFACLTALRSAGGLAAQGGFTIAISDSHLSMLLGRWFTLRRWPQP